MIFPFSSFIELRFVSFAAFAIAVANGPSSHAAGATAAADETSCECLAVPCGACEIETGVKFYAAKCGPGLSRMKSCKKPQCEPVSDQDKCLASLGLAPARAAASVGSDAAEAAEDKPVPPETYAARIVALIGGATVVRGGGRPEAGILGLELKAGDSIETADAARAKLAFIDGNEAVVGPRSKMTIEAHRYSGKAAARRTILLLHKGGVRSALKVAYDGKVQDGERNEYQVRTRVAVAGVRGTDFVSTFDPSERDWKMKVQTFSGQVLLSGLEESGKAGDSVNIPAGREATFVADNAGVPGATLAEQNAAISKGHLRAPWQLKPDELRALASAWSMKDEIAARSAKRSTASSDAGVLPPSVAVCSSPTADYNQCAWTCEGNPSRESRCRTDLPQVKCVRRVCRANGQWADATRMPASQGDFCRGHEPVVRSCDY